MKGNALLVCGALALAACEREEDVEAAFCRSFAESRLPGDALRTRVREIRIEDRRLDAEDAVRMLYPRYVGFTGFGIRRPDHAWRMIHLVRALPAMRRDMVLELEILDDAGPSHSLVEDCAFLHLDGTSQFISARHLRRLLRERALAAADGRKVDCCVPVDRDVR